MCGMLGGTTINQRSELVQFLKLKLPLLLYFSRVWEERGVRGDEIVPLFSNVYYNFLIVINPPFIIDQKRAFLP